MKNSNWLFAISVMYVCGAAYVDGWKITAVLMICFTVSSSATLICDTLEKMKNV